MSKCRNAETPKKMSLLLMRIINYAPGKPGKSRKHKHESPNKHDTNTAGRRGSCDKYGGESRQV